MDKFIFCLNEYLLHFKTLNIKGLGKFVIIENEASIHPILMEFNPPKFEILFEQNLELETDSEFIKYCCEKDKFTQNEIENLISDFAQKINEDIKKNEISKIKSFAVFKKDLTKGLSVKLCESSVFEISNFGLENFKLNPQEAKRTKNEPVIKPKRKFFTKTKKRVALILLFFFIVSGSFVATVLTGLLNPTFIENVVFNAKNLLSKEESKEKTITSTSLIENKTTALVDSNKLSENFLPDTIIPEQIQTTNSKTDIEIKRYFIVENSFLNKDLALKRVEVLKNEGYNSSIAGTTRQGLFIVVYNEYPNKEEANIALQYFRKNVNKDAWLYIK